MGKDNNASDSIKHRLDSGFTSMDSDLCQNDQNLLKCKQKYKIWERIKLYIELLIGVFFF